MKECLFGGCKYCNPWWQAVHGPAASSMQLPSLTLHATECKTGGVQQCQDCILTVSQVDIWFWTAAICAFGGSCGAHCRQLRSGSAEETSSL